MLTDTAVRNARPSGKPYKLADAKGLYLLVRPNGAKYWRCKYRFGGKEKGLAFGVYPIVSLREARDRRDEAKKLLANGVDPAAKKRADKAAELARQVETADTFLRVARDWREVWRTHVSSQTEKEVWANLRRNIFPKLGALPITQVTTRVLLDCLRRIEASGRGATLRKAKTAVSLIFKYAIQNERGITQNPVGNFDRHTFRKFDVKNFPALLDPAQVGQLLRAIDAYRGTLLAVASALRLAPLLFQRIGELRTMRWGR